jgi:hypothetical protein
MSDKIVKDKTKREMGRIKESGSGKRTAYSRGERELGYYDPSTNKTYTPSGLEIGDGDSLSDLIDSDSSN